MPVLAQVNSLVRNPRRKPRIEKELDDEISSHVDLLTDQNIEEGMNPQDAHRSARIEWEVPNGSRNECVPSGSTFGGRAPSSYLHRQLDVSSRNTSY